MEKTMSSIIRFEGLMLFRPDPETKTWLVGILDASDAVLRRLGLDLPEHIFDVKHHLSGTSVISGQKGPQWLVDVVDKEGKPKIKIDGRPGDPKNRLDPNADLLDPGWLINLKKEFHPHDTLKMQTGMLRPIIRLRCGRLYTACKTDGIAYWREGEPKPETFGFIAETMALGIESYESEKIVLNTGTGTIDFPYRPEGYQIDFENVSPFMTHGTHNHMEKPEEHFQMYYKLLFPNVTRKCHLSLMEPLVKSPNPCVMAEDHMYTVYPYKCGGILYGDEAWM